MSTRPPPPTLRPVPRTYPSPMIPMRRLPLVLALSACAEDPALPGEVQVGEELGTTLSGPSVQRDPLESGEGPVVPAVEPEAHPAHPLDPDGWDPTDEYKGELVTVERELFPGGGLRRITCYLPGRAGDPAGRHGPEWSYFKNGYKKETMFFEHGVPQGPFTRAWQNGQLRYQGSFIDGQRHGTYLQWWETGDLQMQFSYDKGQPAGAWLEWYVDMAPRFEEVYVDGRLHGERRTWDKPREDANGDMAPAVLTAIENYVAGKKHGPWQDYDPTSGAPRVGGNYEEGVPVGTWQVRWLEGVLLDEYSYLDGQLHGQQRKFTPEGAALEEITWDKGVKTGPARLFFAGGALQAEGSYVDGQRQGVWRYYSPTGEVTPNWSGIFENDLRVGDLPDES